jgi:acetaldehyde dehydrogenase (acetylating)
MVKAAYGSGKPAYGVGPGNVPAYVDRSADVKRAAELILNGKCFDNGTICASEQSVVADLPIDQQLHQAFIDAGTYFVPPDYINRLSSLVTPGGRLNSRIVGQDATRIAEWAGIPVPANTRCLIAELNGVGVKYPLSCEKLSPILSYYTADGWQAGCERCLELLAYGGQGHSLVIHANDIVVIERFALEKPVARLLVNVSGSQGAIGLTTNLTPSLTLGCGSAGGNITMDNVTARHLVQIRKVAFGRSLAGKQKADSSEPIRIKSVTVKKQEPEYDQETIKQVVLNALAEEDYW